MAASCPKCGNIIEQDFGVAACTRCQAVLFVDMDGNAQLAEDNADSIEAPVGLSLPASEAATTINSTPTPAFDPVPGAPEGASFDLNLSTDLEPSVVEMNHTSSEATQAFQASELPVGEIFEAPPAPKELQVEDSTEMTAEQMQSLAEIEPEGTGVFESTEQVLGGLSYSVIIKNIDTKEIRRQMIEALDDSRFQWDPREVMKTVKAGTLELKNLNPVKASVIVQRMKDLSVKVSWEQHVYN